MVKRVMVAVIGIPFLLLVLIWAPSGATAALLAVMCAIGAWELLHAVGARRILRVSAAAAAALVPLELCFTPDGSGSLFPYLALAYVCLLFVLSIVRYGRQDAIPFGDLTAAVFAGLVFPAMLSCLLRLRLTPDLGKALVFVPLCISFGSDTFALFAGMLFGRHKLAPLVSPKKTVEGAVGGLLGGVVGMALLLWICRLAMGGMLLTWWEALLFGVAGSGVCQVGDLSFSVFKRDFGVKDYGKLLPGHGGILDRFDSVTFVAPFVWLMFGLVRG